MPLLIRPYSPADRDACLVIFDSNTPRFFDPAERTLLVNWLDAKDAARTAYAGNRMESFDVLEQEGQVLACGGFYIPGDAHTAHLVWGMVHNDHHKQGLGKALLLYRINTIQQQHPACSIVLDTTQHSFAFFERLGFSVTAITDNYYGPGLHRYDMLLQGKDVA